MDELRILISCFVESTLAVKINFRNNSEYAFLMHRQLHDLHQKVLRRTRVGSQTCRLIKT